VRLASFKQISVWRHRRKKNLNVLLIQGAVDYFWTKISRRITAIIRLKERKSVQENNFRSILCESGNATVPNKKVSFKTYITGRNNVKLKISARLKTDICKLVGY
jgi:hypothetical protein